MALAILGDIHGSIKALVHAYDVISKRNDVVAIIQVGDFGFYPKVVQQLQYIRPEIPIYAIKGNHEHHPMLEGLNGVTEMAPNIFYVPNGTVMELDGRKIGFLGGASSVDKKMRIDFRMDWFPEEVITIDDVKKFDDVDSVDILITHTPPHRTIIKHFDPLNLLYWGLPVGWVDPSAVFVEQVWGKLGSPKLFSGHMHKSVVDGNVTILDINEIKYVERINDI